MKSSWLCVCLFVYPTVSLSIELSLALIGIIYRVYILIDALLYIGCIP